MVTQYKVLLLLVILSTSLVDPIHFSRMEIRFINSITFGQSLPETCKLEDTDIQQSITMDLF